MTFRVLFFALLTFGALASFTTEPALVRAQAVPTSLPTMLIEPTTAPTSTMFQPTAPPPYPVPTVTATTQAVATTVPAYATTVPGPPVPTIVPGTPPPIASTIGGCPAFPAGDAVYHREIYDAPTLPDSDAMMTSFTAVATGNIQISGANGSWPIDYATASTARYPLVTPNGSPTPANITDFPFDPSFTWQGKGDARSEDHHLLVLDTAACTLYEAYVSGAEPPASWSVTNGKLVQAEPYAAKWDLTKPYPTTVVSGVNAANVPHTVGMVNWDDITAGCVCHALNIDVMAHSLRASAFVFPARAPEAANYYTGPSALAATALPLGSHLRLKRSFALTCPSTVADHCAQAQLVVRALQVLGGYVMDTGGYSGVVYFAMQTRADGTKYFPFNVPDIATLNSIPMSAFEVVK